MTIRGGSHFTGTTGRLLLAGTCLAGLAAISQPAMAQGANKAAARNDVIVVTARYVEENIQTTPVAITAQSDAQLEAANVTSISSLGAVVPNLQTTPGAQQSSGTPQISLRGVQQGASSSLAVPPAVAIYTDDVYHSTTAGSELDFTDVARVEVNRGPQSTLSGNASIAGSIKLFTNDPKGDNSGYATLGYGSRNHMEAAGVIDIGLAPTLSLRALGHFERQTGFVNRLDFTCDMDRRGTPELAGSLPYFQPDSGKKDCVIGQLGGGNTAVGQVKLLWEPSDRVSLLLMARHRREDMEETPTVPTFYREPCVKPTADYPDGLGNFEGTCGAGAANQSYYLAGYKTFGILPDDRFVPQARDGGVYDTYATNCRPILDKSGRLPQATAANPDAPDRVFPAGYPDGLCYEPRKMANHTQFSAKLKADLSDDVHLTAIGAHTKYDNEFTSNGDQTPLGIVISHFINKDQMWSGELRLDGQLFDDKLQWVLGGFAVKTEGYQNNMVSFVDIYQISSVYGVNKSQSVFGHFDYNLTDQWRISGGGRYTHTDIAITIDNPQAVTIIDPVHSTQNRWDWLIATDYQINDDIMVYASAASGSRPPGLTTILSTARQLSPTSAEDLISYEVGVKADMLDNRLRTNLTGFYLDYRKLSTSSAGVECRNEPGDVATWQDVTYGTPAATAACAKFPNLPNPITWYQNVGIPATVKGFEWEITAFPVDGLRFDWSGGYNKYHAKVDAGEPGYLFPGNVRQAEWNMHANLSYDIESEIGTFTPRVDWNWQDRQTWGNAGSRAAPDPDFVIEPYSLWNAQVKYEAPDGDWQAILKVTNLGDKYYHFEHLAGSVNGRWRVGNPREWMLTVRKEF